MAGDELVATFTKGSGYKAEDVLSSNHKTRIVVTKNGGKYQVSNKGKIRRLLGPEAPGKAADDDE